MSKLTVAAIREKYPNPVSSHNYNTDEQYCVGGALCLSMGYKPKSLLSGTVYNFPERSTLAGAIQQLTGMKWFPALTAACKIIELNDASAFDSAWEELGKILEEA